MSNLKPLVDASSSTDEAQSASPEQTVLKEHFLPIILSFVAGFVEAVCFVGLFQTFAAFITGTILLLVVELIRENGEYLTKLIVGISFFVFTFLWAVLIRHLEPRSDKLKSLVLALEAVLIFVFMTAGIILEPLQSADSPATIVVAVIAVLAMSLHSTSFFMVLNKQPPTQFMTGNLTYFIVNSVDAVGIGNKKERSSAPLSQTIKFKLWHYSAVFSLFFLGVAAGAWGLMNFGFVALVLPAAVLVVVSILSFHWGIGRSQ